MSANFMGGPRVALARIRDSRKQKLQQNALAQGATGATTAAAGASRRAEDVKGAEDEGLASSSKAKRQGSQRARDTASPSKKRSKEEVDDASRGRSIDTTANRRDFNHQAGSKSGSVERVIADEHESKFEDQQQSSPRSTSPDLDQKRQLLLDHDDWLGAGEIEGILRKKRKKGESSKGKREKKKVEAASTSGEAHGPKLSDSRAGERGERDVAGRSSGEDQRDKDASEEQAHRAATSSRSQYPDAGKSSSAIHERASPIKLQQHLPASEASSTTKGLPALSLHPEALYTNSIKGLFTSGALGKGNDAKARSVEERLPMRSSHLEENASKAVTKEAKAPLEDALQREGGKAGVEADGELGELETMLLRQREETRRRLFGGH